MAVNPVLIWCLVGFFCNNLPWTRACGSKPAHPKTMCESEACRTAEPIITKMNQDVRPCKNFYQFACGSFDKEAIVPNYASEINSGSAKENQVKEQIKQILEEESPPNELNTFKLAKKFYRACMNEAAIEKKGLEPLRDMLQRLGGWPVVEGDNWVEENFTWTEAMYKLQDASYFRNYFLDLNTYVFSKKSDGLRYRSFRLNVPVYMALYNNDIVARVARLLGASRRRVKREFEEVMSFQKAMLERYREPSKEIPMTLLKIKETYSTIIAWDEFFKRMVPAVANTSADDNDVIYVEQPNYIFNLERVLSETPKRVQANYVMYRLTLDIIPYLNSKVRQILLSRWNDMYAVPRSPDRSKTCVQFVLQHMPASIAGLYIRKFYEKDTKEKVTELTENVKRQFRILLQNAEWMDNNTRQHAIDKLDAMGQLVAYPDELLDDTIIEESHKDVVIDENEFFQSYLNLRSMLYNRLFGNFRAPINHTHYIFFDIGYTKFFNVQYNTVTNDIEIPFGVVQFTWDRNAPQYVNYGNIGYLIGRQISFGFNDVGKQYGEIAGKWPDATQEKYSSKMQCLINQYSKYYVKEFHEYINGTLLLARNLADNIGMKIAYMAYKDWVQRNGPEPELPGLPYTPEQMFWISFATSQCSVPPKNVFIVEFQDSKYEYIGPGVRYPRKFQINAALLNSPDFPQDFNCSVYSDMNCRPKCIVW